MMVQNPVEVVSVVAARDDDDDDDGEVMVDDVALLWNWEEEAVVQADDVAKMLKLKSAISIRKGFIL